MKLVRCCSVRFICKDYLLISPTALEERTPIRIDNQVLPVTGFFNLQAQINGINGASTVSAVLVSPTCQPNRDKSEQQQIENERKNVIRKVKDAMNKSYDTGKIYTVQCHY
ncbi:hypothetical protein PPL_09186 [Heterostelium album PN500]|uniref:Uncharacterized protein n=1 Tax=Heterostelium pallidum (strain ATCC 26659 / Pp 5 / PN500) TaxID=670386 RepID=D3BKV4_HETP5|nr:hypothetical protein PPL_09186 [Heterostelium album PN500]EFA78534.1 hypothetical protein PPL_09186 [Heterostelium album PN500]|eukprot:XP_020430658.1 hypothetical protein PPL_09186 [Heterostelium album PN500]